MAQQNNSELIVLESELEMASHYINPQDIWDLFYDIYNGNEYACAGAMGNMQAESGLYSDNAENKWNTTFGLTDEWLTEQINTGQMTLATFLQRSWWVNDYGFGYGLSQWTDTTRRTKLWSFTIDQGRDIDSQQGQFDYIRWEWTDSSSHYHQFLDNMIAMTDIRTATVYYCNNYEVGKWNETRYTNALYWYNVFAGGGNHISVTVTGNGTAYVDNPSPEDGQDFTLHADPASGETLNDITARDSHGYSIAMEVATQYTYTYDETNWGNFISIYVEFSGETPPPPTPSRKTQHHMPIWMYPFMRC